MEKGASIVGDCLLADDVDTLIGGLTKTYRRARKRMEDAARAPTPEAFHEWRKRVKYHWYHVRLLRTCAPSVLRPLANRLHDLSDALGDAHDLAVLVDRASQWDDVEPGEVEAAVRLADGVRVELQRRTLSLGPRLLTEPAGRLGDRFESYWLTWRRDGEEAAAGSIAELWT